MRRACRVGLVAVLVTALCILTLVDLPPPQLPDLATDPPPTPGKKKTSNFYIDFILYNLIYK